MKNINVFGLVLVSLLTLTSPAWAADWEYWSQYGIKVPINKKVALDLNPQFRFREDMREYYYQKTFIGPAVKVNNYFDAAVYYAFITKETNGTWQDDHVPTLDGIPKWEFLALKFSDRNRLEYSFDKAIWKYRNLFKVAKSIELGNCRISPFISDEIFYDFYSGELNENRFSAGGSIGFAGNLGLSVSYMLRNKKETDGWSDTNVLVTSLQFSF